MTNPEQALAKLHSTMDGLDKQIHKVSKYVVWLKGQFDELQTQLNQKVKPDQLEAVQREVDSLQKSLHILTTSANPLEISQKIGAIEERFNYLPKFEHLEQLKQELLTAASQSPVQSVGPNPDEIKNLSDRLQQLRLEFQTQSKQRSPEVKTEELGQLQAQVSQLAAQVEKIQHQTAAIEVDPSLDQVKQEVLRLKQQLKELEVSPLEVQTNVESYLTKALATKIDADRLEMVKSQVERLGESFGSLSAASQEQLNGLKQQVINKLGLEEFKKFQEGLERFNDELDRDLIDLQQEVKLKADMIELERLARAVQGMENQLREDTGAKDGHLEDLTAQWQKRWEQLEQRLTAQVDPQALQQTHEAYEAQLTTLTNDLNQLLQTQSELPDLLLNQVRLELKPDQIQAQLEQLHQAIAVLTPDEEEQENQTIQQFLQRQELIKLPEDQAAFLLARNQGERNFTGLSLPQADFHGQTFNYLDLSHGDFKESNFSGCEFIGVNLQGANLENVNFNGVTTKSSRLMESRYNLDLTGVNLQNANLHQAELQETSLIGANLQGATLSDGVLWKSNLSDADLRGANLNGADLEKVDLTNANLSGANLYRANLRQAKLIGANLSGANLREAILFDATLEKSNLSNAKLDSAFYNYSTWFPEGFDPGQGGGRLTASKAQLVGVNMSHLYLANFNLSHANLKNANLDSANLNGTNLAHANLNHANLTSAKLENANLYGANIEGANFTGASLENANLQGLNLQHLNLQAVSLARVNLSGADLTELDLTMADFYQANLKGIIADRVKARGTDFSRCNLQGASFQGADLRAANFTDADLTGCDFSNADLRAAKFNYAAIEGVNFTNAQLDGAVLATPEP